MALNVQGKRLSWLCIIGALIIALSLAFVPAYAYAEEQTGSATTEVYLVKDTSGDSGNTDSGNTTPEGTTTTITTTTTEGDGTSSSSSTTKTGDTTPVIPFVVAGVAAAAAITGVAIKKHTANKTIGGDNL